MEAEMLQRECDACPWLHLLLTPDNLSGLERARRAVALWGLVLARPLARACSAMDFLEVSKNEKIRRTLFDDRAWSW